MAQQEALLSVADLLFRTLKADNRFERYVVGVDLTTMAHRLHTFLSNVHTGPWPEVPVEPDWLEEAYPDLAEALVDAIQRPAALGFDIMVSAFDHLNSTMKDDERLLRFTRHLQDRLSSGDEDNGAEEEEDDHSRSADGSDSSGKSQVSEFRDEQSLKSDGGKHEAVGTQDSTNVSSGDFSGSPTVGTKIDPNVFEELRMTNELIDAAQAAWRLVAQNQTDEALGEAIYSALFEGAPQLQALFTTPRAVQAMKFMQGLRAFLFNLHDPPRLKILVETLAFGHLYLDATISRVMVFRDALMDLFVVELNERFTSAMREAWTMLLNYVGGAILFVKANYAERITILLSSWKVANDTRGNMDKFGRSSLMNSKGDRADDAKHGQTERSGKSKGSGGSSIRSLFRASTRKVTDNLKVDMDKASEEHGGQNGTKVGEQVVPTTYREMFHFNAAVMGFGDRSWFSEVLDCFHNIVVNVSNSTRLQEECDILSLRIGKVTRQQVNFNEYKSCMLASLRSLLPKEWSTAHEVAWSWLWDNVERVLMKTMGQPLKWEGALTKMMGNLDESQKFDLRKDIYARFFSVCAAGQDYFKQSNTYLHLIAEKILEMTVELYHGPVKMVDDISALGLRHVGYGIPTELFGPFVTVCVESVSELCKDELVIESFRWSLGLIAKMLTRTIMEGSTIVMKAINTNSVRQLQKAIGCAPRGDRCKWMLVVQVGTQSISPLEWSLESGNLEAAKAMLQDLLTFRADRDRYYFGADEIFTRHPRIVRQLRDHAPGLLPVFLDGLIWRSRVAEHSFRRVNYYVKHLLCKADGQFADTFKWIVESKDPKIVCHPVLIMMSDLIWRHVSLTRFLLDKVLLILTLMVFVASQSVLPRLKAVADDEDLRRYLIFGCRAFVYIVWMSFALSRHSRLVLQHVRQKKFSKMTTFPVPLYLEDWQQQVSLLLTVVLVAMLCIEPILYCWSEATERNELFMDDCSAGDVLKWTYNSLSMVAMFCFAASLVDLTVLSNRISAYVLVVGQVGPELALSLLALSCIILAFTSGTSAYLHTTDSNFFKSVPDTARVFASMTFGLLPLDEFEVLYSEEATLNIVVSIYLIITILFLFNLLVAQLTCAYDANFVDMVGRARLGRIRIIVETMPKVPAKVWTRFVNSLNMNKKLEFNRGDVGITGGIQVLEPAHLNPTTADIIKRFGGSTSPSMQWPQEAMEITDCDRYDRMERLVQKFAQAATSKGILNSKLKLNASEMSSLSEKEQGGVASSIASRDS